VLLAFLLLLNSLMLPAFLLLNGAHAVHNLVGILVNFKMKHIWTIGLLD
jgi:hypothetical protein